MICVLRRKIFKHVKRPFVTLFYPVLESYSTSSGNILRNNVYTIIIFKRYKFNVNLLTLCFVLQKVPKSLNIVLSIKIIKFIDKRIHFFPSFLYSTTDKFMKYKYLNTLC